jgi:hypothetical protein
MSEPEQRQLEIGLRAVDAAEQDLGHQIETKPSKREVIRIAALVALVASLLGSAVSIGVSTLALGEVARQESRTTALGSDVANSKDLAEKAYQAAQAANGQLTARGQTPVPIPPPSDNDPTSTIVAASAARVLAQLPQVPTAQQVAQRLASDQLLNPPAVPVAQVSAVVASYLQANPPPKGEPGTPGEKGQPGENGQNGQDGRDAPPPTDEQIQGAFVAYVEAHPDFLPSQLCANYGQNFNRAQDLVAQDGTRYTLYGCITAVVPPVPSTTSTPMETPPSETTTGG